MSMREYVNQIHGCLEGFNSVQVNRQTNNVEFYVVSQVPADEVATQLFDELGGKFGYIMDSEDIQWYTITQNGITPFCLVRVFSNQEEMAELYKMQFKEDEDEFIVTDRDDEEI